VDYKTANLKLADREIGIIKRSGINNNEKIRHQRIAPVIAKYFDKGSILDVGCKIGSLFDVLKEYGFHDFYGVDLSPQLIDHLNERGYKGEVGDILRLKLPNEYDGVILSHVLEHCDNPKKAMDNIYSLLKLGGKVYLEVPWQKPQSGPSSGGHFTYFTSFNDLNQYLGDFRILWKQEQFPGPPRCISCVLQKSDRPKCAVDWY